MKTTNNTVLITGGTSGIGEALTQKFLELGNTVIICGRNRNKLDQMSKLSDNLHTIPCDLSNEEEIHNLCTKVSEEFPQLNILINNAGVQFNYNISGHLESDQTINTTSIQNEIAINFTAPLLLTNYLIRVLSEQEDAAIINLSSVLAYFPKTDALVYSATKSGLSNFSRGLRREVQSTHIRVFEVLPPVVDTPMTQGRKSNKIQPIDVANSIIKNLQKDRLDIKVGKVNLLFKLNSFFPKLATKIMSSMEVKQ